MKLSVKQRAYAVNLYLNVHSNFTSLIVLLLLYQVCSFYYFGFGLKIRIGEQGYFYLFIYFFLNKDILIFFFNYYGNKNFKPHISSHSIWSTLLCRKLYLSQQSCNMLLVCPHFIVKKLKERKKLFFVTSQLAGQWQSQDFIQVFLLLSNLHLLSNSMLLSMLGQL